MNNHRFIKKERTNRQMAFLVSLIFHLGIIGGIAYTSMGNDWKDLLPQSVKEYFEMDVPQETIPKNKLQA